MSFTLGTVREFSLDIAQFGRAFRRTGRPVCAVILNPHVTQLHPGHEALLEAAGSLPRAVTVLACGDGLDLPSFWTNRLDALFRYCDDLLWPQGMRTLIHVDHGLEEVEALSLELSRIIAVINAIHATDVFLGEKDFELLVSVHQALRDLHCEVRVHGVPTVRHSDGLAFSARNASLDSESRSVATSLSAALTAAAFVADKGAEEVLTAANSVLEAAGVTPEYLALRGNDMGTEIAEGAGRLLVAARCGDVRLIDSAGIPLGIGFQGLANH